MCAENASKKNAIIDTRTLTRKALACAEIVKTKKKSSLSVENKIAIIGNQREELKILTKKIATSATIKVRKK